MIRSLLTVAAAFVFSTPALADGTWAIVSPFPGGAVGYDTSSVVPAKTKGHTMMTTMLFVTDPQGFQGKPANFMLQSVEYDCAAKTVSSLSVQAFDMDGKPVGTVPGSGWTPLNKSPWLDMMAHTACDGMKLKDAVMAEGRDAAMQKMKTFHAAPKQKT
jgi:hypothetical protein